MSLHHYVAQDLKVDEREARAIVGAMTAPECRAATAAIRRAGANPAAWSPGTLAALIPARARLAVGRAPARVTAAPARPAAPVSTWPPREPLPVGAYSTRGDVVTPARSADQVAAQRKAATRQWFCPAPGTY